MTPEDYQTRQRRIGFLILLGIAVLAVKQASITWNTVWFLVLLLPVIIFHEVAHGAVAYLFGDDTAKKAGRLTLNPIKHIDPFGTVLLPLMLMLLGLPPFGYAKPVPVNLGKLRKRRPQALLVSLAGPATNLLLAFACVVFIGVFWNSPPSLADVSNPNSAFSLVHSLGILSIYIGMFNLLPLPPLDGAAILEFFIPTALEGFYYNFRRYAMFILLAVVLMGGNLLGKVMDTISTPVINAYNDGICKVVPWCPGTQPENASATFE